MAPDEKVSAPRVLPKRQKLSLIKRLDPADNEQQIERAVEHTELPLGEQPQNPDCWKLHSDSLDSEIK